MPQAENQWVLTLVFLLRSARLPTAFQDDSSTDRASCHGHASTRQQPSGREILRRGGSAKHVDRHLVIRRRRVNLGHPYVSHRRQRGGD